MAIRNGDELAEALGIPLMRNKVLAFMLSVFYAGLAGGLYAGFVRFLGPGLAGVEHTFDMTMYMLVGGLGTLLGPAARRARRCPGSRSTCSSCRSTASWCSARSWWRW